MEGIFNEQSWAAGNGVHGPDCCPNLPLDSYGYVKVVFKAIDKKKKRVPLEGTRAGKWGSLFGSLGENTAANRIWRVGHP